MAPHGGSPYKRTQKEEAFAFCLLALTLASSSILLLRHSFAILEHLASWTKQLLNSWPFETAIVGPART